MIEMENIYLAINYQILMLCHTDVCGMIVRI